MTNGEAAVIPATETAVRIFEHEKYIDDVGIIPVYGIEIYESADKIHGENSLAAVHNITSVKGKIHEIAHIIELNRVSAVHLYDVVEDMLD